MAVAVGNWLASVDEPPEEARAVWVLREAVEDESELVREQLGVAVGENVGR